jgi:hypothetical protein
MYSCILAGSGKRSKKNIVAVATISIKARAGTKNFFLTQKN